MPKNVTQSEVEKHSKYLNELMGDDKTSGNAGSSEETDDDETEGADAGEEVAGEGDDAGDAGDDASGADDTSDGSGQRGTGKEPKQKDGKEKGARGNATKPSIDEAQLRQLYDTLKARLQPVFRSQDAKIKELTGQLQGFKEANRIAEQYKLTPQQQLDAFKLAAAMREDLGATIKYLLTQAKSRGINIDGIGGTQVDMNAIKEMIAREMQPITGAFQTQRQQEEALGKARNEVEAFYGEFPDAKVHEKELGELLQRYPDLTLQSAYMRLYRWYSEKGLDFRQPLSVVMQQRGNQQQGRKPIGVRGATDTMGGAAGRDEDNMASVDDSWKSIVRDVMRKAGHDVSKL